VLDYIWTKLQCNRTPFEDETCWLFPLASTILSHIFLVRASPIWEIGHTEAIVG
jgi:hypothetical protein